MKNYVFLFLFCVFARTLSAQFNFNYKDSIPVKVGTKTLALPWGGGVNFAQFSEIDFDFDGDMDLFFFDRSRNNVRLFEQTTINSVKQYRAVYNAKNYFPPNLDAWTTFLDYDQDGKNDLFTSGIGGVKVYQNVGNAQNGLIWQLAKQLIYSDYNGNYLNLYVSSSDIPAFVDVDFDGDIDVLTFNIGGAHLEYHQNQSQELYGHSDSLIYALKNQCWGTFLEDPNNGQIILNSTDLPCTSGNVPNPQLRPDKNSYGSILDTNTTHLRHAGSTILAIDYDNSGAYDLVLGDVSSETMSLLLNDEGAVPNSNSAISSVDVNFPSNTTPVNIITFPAAFYIDVDFDGVKDLIACPNAKGPSHNFKSVYFYKNVGTNSLPNFSFQSQSFLQDEMIDIGTAAIPTFVDENGDGLEDLFVANFYSYKDPYLKESVISNFRNIGTLNQASFSFVESNYLDLASQTLGLRAVPTFGDVDNDGDKDLFLGLIDGSLMYYQNTAGAGNQITYATAVPNYKDNLGSKITVQNYCFPQLFDLNEDGLLDLILGNKTGELAYYENIGTASSPSFQLKNDTLGKIDVATASPDGYTAPHFFKYKDTIRLFLGGFDGKLRFYDKIKGNLNASDTFHLISSAFLGIDVEGYSSSWVNDLDNDGKLDLFVGGDLGGIFHLEHDSIGNLGLSKMKKSTVNFDVFPNPTQNSITVSFEGMENESDLILVLFNTLGQKIYERKIKQNEEIELSHLNSGVYFVALSSRNFESSHYKKLIIQK